MFAGSYTTLANGFRWAALLVLFYSLTPPQLLGVSIASEKYFLASLVLTPSVVYVFGMAHKALTELHRLRKSLAERKEREDEDFAQATDSRSPKPYKKIQMPDGFKEKILTGDDRGRYWETVFRAVHREPCRGWGPVFTFGFARGGAVAPHRELWRGLIALGAKTELFARFKTETDLVKVYAPRYKGGGIIPRWHRLDNFVTDIEKVPGYSIFKVGKPVHLVRREEGPLSVKTVEIKERPSVFVPQVYPTEPLLALPILNIESGEISETYEAIKGRYTGKPHRSALGIHADAGLPYVYVLDPYTALAAG